MSKYDMLSLSKPGVGIWSELFYQTQGKRKRDYEKGWKSNISKSKNMISIKLNVWIFILCGGYFQIQPSFLPFNPFVWHHVYFFWSWDHMAQSHQKLVSWPLHSLKLTGRTCQDALAKENSSSNPSDSGAMLVSGRLPAISLPGTAILSPLFWHWSPSNSSMFRDTTNFSQRLAEAWFTFSRITEPCFFNKWGRADVPGIFRKNRKVMITNLD